MTDTITLRMTGTMTAVTPISIVQPGAKTVLAGGDKALKVAHEVIYLDGRRVEVPCIPSSTLRGGLRRAAAMVAYSEQMGAGEKPRLSDFLYNIVGGVKDAGKEAAEAVLVRQARREKNPVIALFGAGCPWAASHAYIHTAYADPAKNDTGFDRPVRYETVGGRRTDDVAQNPGILALMDENAPQDWVEMRETTKADKKANDEIKKLEKALKMAGSPEEKESIANEIEALKEAKSGKNSLLRTLHHTIMPRGTEMCHEITLRDVAPHEAGLFMAALDHLWSVNPYFGGKIAHGYGLVSAKWAVSLKEKMSWSHAGDIAVEPHAGLTGAPDVVGTWIDAWEAYRASGAMNLIADAA